MIDTILSAIPTFISALALLFSIFTFGYNIWRGRPQIKITFPHEDVNVIFHPLTPDRYLKETRICINAQIANLSSNPISISHFSLRDKDNRFDLPSESFLHAEENYPIAQYPNGSLYVIPIGRDQIILPLKIAPYSIVIGYIFFADDVPARPFSGILTAHTPTKNFSFNLRINLPSLPLEQDVAVLWPEQNTQ